MSLPHIPLLLFFYFGGGWVYVYVHDCITGHALSVQVHVCAHPCTQRTTCVSFLRCHLLFPCFLCLALLC